MGLSIISGAPGSEGCALKPYPLDGIDTVGVLPHELFSICYKNLMGQRALLIVSIDGTDVTTGQQAVLAPRDGMFAVDPGGELLLYAWQETAEGGARLIFSELGTSVVAHTHGDTSAKGYISVAVFVEGSTLKEAASYGAFGSTRPVNGPYYLCDNFGPRDAGLKTAPEPERSPRSGPAAGAGEYVSQPFTTRPGLAQPVFSRIVQVRYMWWGNLVAQLRRHPVHPTGFVTPRMANLGTTPRISGPRPTPLQEFSRLV